MMPAQRRVKAPLLGLARRARAGRLLWLCYHRPLGMIRQSILEGGPFEQRRTAASKRAMIEAAGRLRPLAPPVGQLGRAITVLSGVRYWYQTAFCFASLQRFAEGRIDLSIFDDGTLPQVADRIARVIPWARFLFAREINERLDSSLPVKRFPTLRAHRLVYPHLRKLTDLHAGASGWTVVLDSDMLFFRRPDEFLGWCAMPDRSIFIEDSMRSYGYSDALMAELSAGCVPDRVNVGLYALLAEAIDWDRAEWLCRTLLEREGPNYLHEQALTALLLADQGARALSRRDYVVMPDLAEGRLPTAALHHYVAQAKRSYFQYGWRRVAGDLAAASKAL